MRIDNYETNCADYDDYTVTDWFYYFEYGRHNIYYDCCDFSKINTYKPNAAVPMRARRMAMWFTWEMEHFQ